MVFTIAVGIDMAVSVPGVVVGAEVAAGVVVYVTAVGVGIVVLIVIINIVVGGGQEGQDGAKIGQDEAKMQPRRPRWS